MQQMEKSLKREARLCLGGHDHQAGNKFQNDHIVGMNEVMLSLPLNFMKYVCDNPVSTVCWFVASLYQ